MLLTTKEGNGKGADEVVRAEGVREVPHREKPTNGTQPKGAPEAGRLNGAFADWLGAGEEARPERRPALGVFCYEAPDSVVGRHVARLSAALARRKVPVHLYSRHDFPAPAGVTVHAVGEGGEGDIVARVQEFTHRACNVFLRQHQAGTAPGVLLGHEWSAIPALSLLRSLKGLDTILSLHSLERQRSDMTGELSRRIEEIETAGLREAKAVLTGTGATAEVAKYWVPECAERLGCLRQPFPAEQFHKTVDPGAVKARYQVGLVDPTIVYLGDLDDRYGPDLLVKAMPPVLRNHPQARLVIVGDGQLFWPLRVYTRYLLLEHAVRLVGDLREEPLQELIAAADVVAVPSRDATPWWPIQAAWAARRPVIATHNAAPGLLEHEKDAVLFHPNENSCVWGIERILFDPDLGKTIAARGAEKLEERFGWNIVAEQIEELMGVRQAR
jgi:glycosyltransferase involved in cell wall biosynthesis